MINRLIRISAATVALMAMTGAAHASTCAKPRFTASEMRVVNPNQIDQRLVSSSVRKVINFQRCLAGRSSLIEDQSMITASLMHSRNMARYNKLSHISRQPGEETLRKRFRKAGLRHQVYAENILRMTRLDHKGGKIIVDNAANCSYLTRSKKRIGVHTYASLAEWSGHLWMNSRPHKMTLLRKRLTSTAAAAAYRNDPKQPCGAFYVTQNFGRNQLGR